MMNEYTKQFGHVEIGDRIVWLDRVWIILDVAEYSPDESKMYAAVRDNDSGRRKLLKWSKTTRVVVAKCPFTHAHTRHFCGTPGCRES